MSNVFYQVQKPLLKATRAERNADMADLHEPHFLPPVNLPVRLHVFFEVRIVQYILSIDIYR